MPQSVRAEAYGDGNLRGDGRPWDVHSDRRSTKHPVRSPPSSLCVVVHDRLGWNPVTPLRLMPIRAAERVVTLFARA